MNDCEGRDWPSSSFLSSGCGERSIATMTYLAVQAVTESCSATYCFSLCSTMRCQSYDTFSISCQPQTAAPLLVVSCSVQLRRFVSREHRVLQICWRLSRTMLQLSVIAI